MIAKSMTRMIAPLMALVVACTIALVLAVQHLRREPPVETKAASAATASKSAPGARDAGPPGLAAVQAEAGKVAAALAGSAVAPDRNDDVPAFDIARIEPTGDAVIAGRTAPGATVELLRNGEVHDRAVADQSGQFAMVPPRLPAGSYELTLRARLPDGKHLTSRQSVAVTFAPSPNERPVVALMTPQKPTLVLSQSGAPKEPGGTVAVDAVELEGDGRFHVSGRARPGAAVRFYLNDSFVASVTANADGRFAVTINEGVAPGNYRIRLDEVQPNSGAVQSRAEVPFSVPDTVVTASVPTQAAAPRPQDQSTAASRPLAAAERTQLATASPSAVVVPKIATATVSRGDSLWRISHLTYGVGTRYSVIYKANREQIRNPNLIYPGQVFVLPADEARPQ
jgi:nucleoid-associated protein YgaU